MEMKFDSDNLEELSALIAEKLLYEQDMERKVNRADRRRENAKHKGSDRKRSCYKSRIWDVPDRASYLGQAPIKERMAKEVTRQAIKNYPQEVKDMEEMNAMERENDELKQMAANLERELVESKVKYANLEKDMKGTMEALNEALNAAEKAVNRQKELETELETVHSELFSALLLKTFIKQHITVNKKVIQFTEVFGLDNWYVDEVHDNWGTVVFFIKGIKTSPITGEIDPYLIKGDITPNGTVEFLSVTERDWDEGEVESLA